MTLREIRIVGGPDARALRVIDMETGDLVLGVVKVELLAVPGAGALVNITQTCRIVDLDIVAYDADEPLIDLPDDHPDADTVADVLARHPGPAKVPASATNPLGKPGYPTEAPHAAPAPQLQGLSTPARETLMDMAVVAGARQRGTPAVSGARQQQDRTAPSAPLDVPPPLPDMPSQKARRAPPPERMTAADAADDDLAADDKYELAQLLAPKIEEQRAQMPTGAKWPFPPAAEIGRTTKKAA